MNHLAIEAILNNYDGQVEIKPFHNQDFTDIENDIPSGIVMLHPPKVTVHVDSLPLNTFDYLAVCLIKKEGLNDQFFEGKDEKLKEAAPQYVGQPASLDVRDPSTAQDGKHWQAEMGENENSFAGIFKHVKGRDIKYYVCAQAGAPVACRELREKIANNPMTFEQLLVDKDYNYCHYLAQRNVQRIAYNVARAFGVPIAHMMDTGTKTDFNYSAKPMKAVPTYMQPVSMIKPIADGRVGVFNKVTPISECSDFHFVYEGPYHGIGVFKMNKKGIGLGLPAHSGRLEKSQSVKDVNSRCHGLVCEQMSPKEHPDVVKETFRRVEDDTFLQEMNKLGWKTHGMNNLIPVAIKIHDPNVQRIEGCGHDHKKKKKGEERK